MIAILLGIPVLAVQRASIEQGHARANQPYVNIAALRGQGHLAFMWGGQLYVVDASKGTLHALPEFNSITNLTWSPDGRWLAYIRVTGEVWIARADGSRLHAIPGLPTQVTSVSWAPAADRLAVLASQSASSSLWIVTPDGRPHHIATGATSVRWSPDGTALAYSLTLPHHNPVSRSDALFTMSVTGGRPIKRIVAKGDGIQVAGWWPTGKGVLYWRDPLHSASLASDGLGLYSLPFGKAPRLLAPTLPYSDFVRWSSMDQLLLLVTGGGRELWHNKTLIICDVQTNHCRPLLRRSKVVMLDPAWAPSGREVAFVEARDLGPVSGFADPRALLPWIRSRTLWVASITNARVCAVRLPAGQGVFAPEWTYHSDGLLYFRDGSLWLTRVDGSPPVKIVDSLSSNPGLVVNYGYTSWSGTWAWQRR